MWPWGSEVDELQPGVGRSAGPSAKASEEDQERTRRLADAEMHRHHLESLLDQRDRETAALREVGRRTGELNSVLLRSWC